MSKELQKDEFILPGNLGTVNGRPITEMFKSKDGYTTLTIGAIPDEPEAPTLSRNLMDEAGLWGTDKKQNSLTNPKQDKTEAMIKANELRIGNLVNVNGRPEKIFQLEETQSDTIINAMDSDLLLQLSPIPLSPEWLERAGFLQYDGTISTYLSLKDFSIEKDGNNWVITIRYDSSNCYGDIVSKYYHHKNPIQYLHQLQNLYFALTGEELTFKPAPSGSGE